MTFTDIEKDLIDKTVSDLVDISKMLKDDKSSGNSDGGNSGVNGSENSQDKDNSGNNSNSDNQNTSNKSNKNKSDKTNTNSNLKDDLDELQDQLDKLNNELNSKKSNTIPEAEDWDGNDVIADPSLVNQIAEVFNEGDPGCMKSIEGKLRSNISSKSSKAQAEAKEAGHGAGSRIFDILDKKNQGIAPGWLEKIRPYLTIDIKDFTPNIVKSYRNRYTQAMDYEVFQPYNQPKKDKLKDVLFAIDTSGSIQEKDLVEFYGQISNLIKYNSVEGEIYFWDDRVRDKGKFKDYPSFVEACKQFKGGGGTNIKDTIKQAIENKHKLVVVYTDGYFDTDCIKDEQWNEFTYIIWVLYTKEDWLRFKIPFPQKQTKCLLNREEEE